MITMNTLSNLVELLESKNFHGKQKDLNGFPYINHLLRVNLYVNMFLNGLSKYDEQCVDLNFRNKISTVALLHDVLEDCDDWNKNKTYSQNNLEQFLKDYLLTKFTNSQFNQQDVDDILATCQKLNKNNFADKQEYLDNLLTVSNTNDIDKMALLVKMADTLDNMNFFRMLQPNSKSLSKLNLTDMDDLPTIISEFKPFLSKLAEKLDGETGNNNEYAVKIVKRLKNYLSNYELYRYHFIGNFLPEFAYQQHMVRDTVGTIGHEVATGTVGYEVNEVEATLKEIATLYHGYMIAPTKINEINELARNAVSNQSLLQKNRKNISYLTDYIEARRLKKQTKNKL